jgi:hypothetical protein
VKLQWKPKKSTEAPFEVDVPDVFTQAFVIEKDSKRFPKTGGWGYALFNYDAATGKFTADPATADCGHSCHVAVKSRTTSFIRTKRGERDDQPSEIVARRPHRSAARCRGGNLITNVEGIVEEAGMGLELVRLDAVITAVPRAGTAQSRGDESQIRGNLREAARRSRTDRMHSTIRPRLT